MKKMYVICFKELKNFKLIFTKAEIYYNKNFKKIALYNDDELMTVIDLSRTKLVHKNTSKENDYIIVRFYLEDIEDI